MGFEKIQRHVTMEIKEMGKDVHRTVFLSCRLGVAQEEMRLKMIFVLLFVETGS